MASVNVERSRTFGLTYDFQKQPKQFNPRFEVVSCFFEYDGTILLLHRWPQKSQGNKWGVPAGKIEPGETPLQAMVRESKEETNLSFTPEQFHYVKKIFVRYPDYDFIYHIFHMPLRRKPNVTLNPHEHQHFVWRSPQEVLEMDDAVLDLDECIKLFYNL